MGARAPARPRHWRDPARHPAVGAGLRQDPAAPQRTEEPDLDGPGPARSGWPHPRLRHRHHRPQRARGGKRHRRHLAQHRCGAELAEDAGPGLHPEHQLPVAGRAPRPGADLVRGHRRELRRGERHQLQRPAARRWHLQEHRRRAELEPPGQHHHQRTAGVHAQRLLQAGERRAGGPHPQRQRRGAGGGAQRHLPQQRRRRHLAPGARAGHHDQQRVHLHGHPGDARWGVVRGGEQRRSCGRAVAQHGRDRLDGHHARGLSGQPAAVRAGDRPHGHRHRVLVPGVAQRGHQRPFPVEVHLPERRWQRCRRGLGEPQRQPAEQSLHRLLRLRLRADQHPERLRHVHRGGPHRPGRALHRRHQRVPQPERLRHRRQHRLDRGLQVHAERPEGLRVQRSSS